MGGPTVDGAAGSVPPRATTFERAVAITIELEGGGAVVERPNDPGGLTRWGISSRYHPDVDVRNLTRAGAEAIYRSRYWSPIHGDDLPPALALVVFDAAVIPGLGWAITALQRVLRLEDDGVIGPQTLTAARASSWRTTQAFTAARVAEFQRRVRIRPVLMENEDGWRNRCLAVYRHVVLWEREASA